MFVTAHKDRQNIISRKTWTKNNETLHEYGMPNNRIKHYFELISTYKLAVHS